MIRLIHGSSPEALRDLDDNSVDSIVTDPPYGLSFMGKTWDYDVPSVDVWRECLRVLKPGGHLLAFAGTRTQHRMAVRIEDAGFEIRDMIAWVYGSGFPKSLDVSKAIDKAAGEIRPRVAGGQGGANSILGARKCGEAISGEAISGEAQQWAGWGTALKPALEPITVARKPLIGTVAENVTTWGTGAINVDGCRVGTSKNVPASPSKTGLAGLGVGWGLKGNVDDNNANNPNVGRFPANLIHDGSDEVVGLFPSPHGAGFARDEPGGGTYDGTTGIGMGIGIGTKGFRYGDSGSAARFFYCAKASRSDREDGCDHLPAKTAGEVTGGREEGSAGLDSPRAGAGCRSSSTPSCPDRGRTWP